MSAIHARNSLLLTLVVALISACGSRPPSIASVAGKWRMGGGQSLKDENGREATLELEIQENGDFNYDIIVGEQGSLNSTGLESADGALKVYLRIQPAQDGSCYYHFPKSGDTFFVSRPKGSDNLELRSTDPAATAKSLLFDYVGP